MKKFMRGVAVILFAVSLTGCTINVGSGLGESPETQTPEEARAAVAQFECQEFNSVMRAFHGELFSVDTKALDFALPFRSRNNAVASKIASYMEWQVEGVKGLAEGEATGDYEASITASTFYLAIWDELSKTCFDSGVELIGGNPQ